MKQKSELMGLREYALGFPGAYEEFPWGDRVVKVKGKIFVFLGETAGGIGIAVKLPRSHQAALHVTYGVRPRQGGLDRRALPARRETAAAAAARMDRRELPDHRAEGTHR